MRKLPRCGPKYFFDGLNSFLHFMITDKDAAIINLNHSCDYLFQKVEVLYAGTTISFPEGVTQTSTTISRTLYTSTHTIGQLLHTHHVF